MNTSQIKNFAIASRNLLKAGVIQRFQVLGFDADGNLTKGMPTRIQGGATLFAGQFLSEDFYDKWTSLYEHVQQVGVKEVYEEAAYTWFNRLVAIRIMQKNHFIDPVLAYTNEEARLPRIVAEARAGHIATEMLPADRARLHELLGDDSKLNEQFALLIENYCRFNPVIYNCFGGIEQYISLLLPDNILAPGGFVDLLNHTTYISDEDFQQSELIGWLYQFYISERKDEVFDGFKKGKKAEAEDIPAATQIFTPNWIVKYMVQNTLGRIYLDNNPYSELKAEMKYLVEPAEPTPKEAILKINNLEDYKLMDNACGSGHILVEGFDLFYKMYLEEAYSSRTAIENIFRKNLIGIDIDTRAKQLATFALLMKAAKVDPSFLDCKVMPRVLDMPGTNFSRPLTELLREFYMSDDRTLIQETYDAFELLKQAHNLGSIMKFNLSSKTRKEMALRYEEWIDSNDSKSESSYAIRKEIFPSVSVILALTDSYTSVVMNPPYMSIQNMNAELSSYAGAHYVEGQCDLMTIFMQVAMRLTTSKGLWAMINLPSWLFLPSFDEIRDYVIDNQFINSFLYMGRGIFGSDFGSVSFAIRNTNIKTLGTYRKLFNVQGQVRSVADIEYNFFNRDYGFYTLHQDTFYEIPNHAIAFWLPKRILSAFSTKVLDYGTAKKGLSTGSNNLFLRLWFEVSSAKSIYEATSFNNSKKWFPINKGGIYRKWYGNNEYVINWYNDGEDIKAFSGSVIRNPQYYLRESLTWTMLSASCFGIRYSKQGKLFEGAGPSLFIEGADKNYILGFLCSKIGNMVLRALNPTINININDVLNLPIIKDSEHEQHVINVVRDNIALSEEDWDAHETSWDFKENELVRVYKENHGEGLFFDANRLVDVVTMYKSHWEEQFNKLHANEEELNRQFIEIYGLQDELTPDVPMDEITILQQGEISIDNNSIVWHDDVLVKQLLSYAIGCMMGRYRLDRPGLHIAYPNPAPADIEPYEFQGEEFEIDDDGIIPLLGRDCAFEDNAYNRVVKFLSQVFGDSFLNENLNFIESALGKSVEDYLVKDFWKDHKKMYSNRPIYWLFSSKKGAFQCLAYMHRMNPYTAEIVRSKYLLPYIDYLKGKIAEDTAKAASLSTVERRNLDKMQVALAECLEYEERLHNVADSQIGFDLDDGVVVNYAKYGDILAKLK